MSKKKKIKNLSMAVVVHMGKKKVILTHKKLKSKNDNIEYLKLHQAKLLNQFRIDLYKEGLDLKGVNKITIETVRVYKVAKKTNPDLTDVVKAKGAIIYVLSSGESLFVYKHPSVTIATNTEEFSKTTTYTQTIGGSSLAARNLKNTLTHWENYYNNKAETFVPIVVEKPLNKHFIDVSKEFSYHD